MREVNQKLLKSLTLTEYCDFIRSALGFLTFFSMNNPTKVIYKNDRKNGAKKVATILNNKTNVIINDVFVSKANFKHKTFNIDNNEEDIEEYFLNGKLNESDFYFLLVVAKDSFKNFYEDKTENFLELKTSKDINNLNDGPYSFIIGSGIDYDYGASSWNKIINNLKKKVASQLHIHVGEVSQFSQVMCNTNYYIPQMYKEINKSKYFKSIYNLLYKDFGLNLTNVNEKPEIEDFNLYQVARIIAIQSIIYPNQKHLTFNYNDYLELTLKNSFNINSTSVFKSNRTIKEGINVVHLHGYLPLNYLERKDKSKCESSLVLSHQEYLNAYKTKSSFTAGNLYNQLSFRNVIIGNSLQDYEEQKVFYNHHRNNLSEYSYIFIFKENINKLNYFKICTFYKLGVIPIFFDNPKELNKYLRTIYTNLDDWY